MSDDEENIKICLWLYYKKCKENIQQSQTNPNIQLRYVLYSLKTIKKTHGLKGGQSQNISNKHFSFYFHEINSSDYFNVNILRS